MESFLLSFASIEHTVLQYLKAALAFISLFNAAHCWLQKATQPIIAQLKSSSFALEWENFPRLVGFFFSKTGHEVKYAAVPKNLWMLLNSEWCPWLLTICCEPNCRSVAQSFKSAPRIWKIPARPAVKMKFKERRHYRKIFRWTVTHCTLYLRHEKTGGWWVAGYWRASCYATELIGADSWSDVTARGVGFHQPAMLSAPIKTVVAAVVWRRRPGRRRCREGLNSFSVTTSSVFELRVYH